VENTGILVGNPSKSATASNKKIKVNPQEDLALICFDAENKPIYYTHYNLVSNVLQLDKFFENITTDDIFLVSLPYSTALGIQMFMNWPLYKRATLVILPPVNEDNFVEHISHFKTTVACLPSTLTHKISNFKSDQLSSLRQLFITFKIHQKTRQEITQTFPNATSVEGFVLEETCGFALCNSSPGSHFSLLPNIDAKIVDPVTGQSIKGEGIGELFLRGLNIKPSATDEFLRTKYFAKRTNKSFDILDKIGNAIHFNDIIVYPSEIEEILSNHEQIREIQVVSVKEDNVFFFHANVVLAEGSTLEANDIIDFVSSKTDGKRKIKKCNISKASTAKKGAYDYSA